MSVYVILPSSGPVQFMFATFNLTKSKLKGESMWRHKNVMKIVIHSKDLNLL